MVSLETTWAAYLVPSRTPQIQVFVLVFTKPMEFRISHEANLPEVGGRDELRAPVYSSLETRSRWMRLRKYGLKCYV